MLFNNSVDLAELDKENPAAASQEIKDPWIYSEILKAKGEKVYKARCALCHGLTGRGEGSPGLTPPPRDLVKGDWKQGGSLKELFITLQKGIPQTSMVSFQYLPKVDRWAVLHYIRTLTKNKVKDNPQELEEFAKTAL